MPWDPGQYLKFAGPRLRPGLDLISRLPELAPESIYDLGCGTGELTELLAARFPAARTVGVDSSEQMLAQARARGSRLGWMSGDLRAWRPDRPASLIFSNAALHWVPAHEQLFPELVAALAPDGLLAVQMPANHTAPSHRLIHEVAALPRYQGRIPLRAEPVLGAEQYYRLLAPLSVELELWSTEYLHVLDGPEPVLDWVKGTTLVPVEEALAAAEFQDFVAEYRSRLAQAYPVQPDGRTLFAFRRLFLLARRAGAGRG